MFENDEMTEQTNLTEEIENEDTLDDEDEVWEYEDDTEETEADEAEEETVEDEDSENEAETDEQTEEQATEEQTSSDEEMFPQELVVYGEKKQVTMAEAKGYIQKGLAYDKAKEKWEQRLSAAQNDPRIAFVDELAKAEGTDAATYMANSRLQSKYAKLLETFDNVEAVPKEILQMFTDGAEKDKNEAQKAIEAIADAEKEEKLLEEYSLFMENHPELADVPKEVMELKAAGETLEGAFARVELSKALKQISELTKEKAELEKNIKVLKQNEKNKQTKLPSSRSNAVKEDDLVWEVE